MIGLVSWIAIGLVVGLATRWLLPGPRSWGVAMTASVLGALAGGVGATALGMGGTAELDPRALALAFLAAVLVAVLIQLVRVMRGAPR